MLSCCSGGNTSSVLCIPVPARCTHDTRTRLTPLDLDACPMTVLCGKFALDEQTRPGPGATSQTRQRAERKDWLSKQDDGALALSFGVREIVQTAKNDDIRTYDINSQLPPRFDCGMQRLPISAASAIVDRSEMVQRTKFAFMLRLPSFRIPTSSANLAEETRDGSRLSRPFPVQPSACNLCFEPPFQPVKIAGLGEAASAHCSQKCRAPRNMHEGKAGVTR